MTTVRPLLAFSMAFAHWKLIAARVFSIVSVAVFFGPVIIIVFSTATRAPRGDEWVGFLVMAALSLLANWCIASLVRRQLEQAPNS